MGKKKPKYRMNAEKARILANEHLLFHYSIGLIGGEPQLLTMADTELWIVPIMLTSPGAGPVGEIGVIAVNAQTGDIAGGTPRVEVAAAEGRLLVAKHDELEAAFLRAKQE